MKYLIINADDFGNYSSVDKGIIEGIKRGVITSTSVMVTRKHAAQAKDLLPFPNISIGLHFELPKRETSPVEEFNKQLKIFGELVGKKPDHIDTHKVKSYEITGFREFLDCYSKENKTPIRDWGYANLIDKFFALNFVDGSLDLDIISPAGLIKTLNQELKEGYNELMTHAGFVDEEVTATAGYGKPREIELQSLLSKEFQDFLANNKDIKLVSWNDSSFFVLP